MPAVQKLAGIELAAVATNNQKTAAAAAKAFGARVAYGNAKDLFEDPDIDIITVAVKVPDHRDLVLGALAAGKHVYCEWPLGRNAAEAEEFTAAARRTGVHAVIGLQTRSNPAAHRARDLIASGAIGRPLSARIISNTVAFGPKVEKAMAFAESAENGATLVTIQGGHTLDLAIAVLGPLAEAAALTTTQYPEVVVDNAERQIRMTADHILVQAHLANGMALSVEVAGGRPSEAPFCLQVTGETGSLALTGGAPPGFQSGRLHLMLNGDAQQIDQGEAAAMTDTAANVAGIYAALRDDISKGTSIAPDFGHAVRLTRLIEDMMASSSTGTRKSAADWPAL